MKVLVIDNDIAHRGKIINFITSLGHQVVDTIINSEIIELCKKSFPDLILMDYNVGKTTNINLLKQLRQLGGMSNWNMIVLMSVTLNDDILDKAVDAGADDVVVKPVTNLILKTKIMSALRQHNLREEVFTVAHNLVLTNRAMESMVTQDFMTGIANANMFEDALEREWFEAKKLHSNLSLIMIDIDYLGKFNHAYGAKSGDELIASIAMKIKESLPSKVSLFARLDGGTFGIILSGYDKSKAVGFAQQIVDSVFTAAIPHKESGGYDVVTISAGVSSVGKGEYNNPWDLKESAEFALYKAKHYGRNRVHFTNISETIKP